MKYIYIFMILFLLSGCFFWKGTGIDGQGPSPAEQTAQVVEGVGSILPWPFNYIATASAGALAVVAANKKNRN